MKDFDVANLLKRTRFEMAIAFSEALDARDQYTAGHSRRVTEYAMGIGERMNLAEHDMDLLHKSALLHDIGKIGVPDHVLHKRSKLSYEEYSIIKTHSEIGSTILKSIKSFEEIIPSVYHHHERFDGKGYPHGISGGQIPLYARIIAVADSFDAMTSNRPYRRALSQERALSEIELNRGIQFDPDITDVFLAILRESPYHFNIQIEPEYYL